mmetsp:Transcript_9582/g.28956  ORF Transcript_9582/g.28956 Transcript_9582/m.28956 type:complete len:498 (+) Transcript_9582:61-1554(+)
MGTLGFVAGGIGAIGAWQGRPRARPAQRRVVRMAADRWDHVRAQVEHACEKVGMDAELLFAKEARNGPLKAPITRDGALRLFGRGEDDVRVTFFRDPAYWCPYCQRVQLQLELKQVPYRVRTVNMRCYGDKPGYYRRLVPSGAIPAIIFDDKELMTESLDIMMRLEDMFPDNTPLIPRDDPAKMEAFRAFMRLERTLFSSWFQYMFSGGFGFFGGGGGRMRESFLSELSRWDEAVQKYAGGFILGEEPCLIDVLAASFVERMVASALYWKAIEVRKEFPGIDAWMRALESLHAYAALKADFFTTVHDLPPQTGNSSFEPGSEPYQKFVDGQDGSWELPLPPLRENKYEPVDFDGDEVCFRIEAAAALVRGGDPLINFCLRAVGSRPRTVSAPLSDPDASPGNRGREGVELALRCVAMSLVSGTDDPQVRQLVSKVLDADKLAVAGSLTYLRDRIGVPRDMSFGAARQLRAHLNWFCRNMLGERRWSEVSSQLAVAKA